MAVNRDKPQSWQADIAASVAMYNRWFMTFAPGAFRDSRAKASKDVEAAIAATRGLTDIKPLTLQRNPGILPTLRMSTCPPIAVDRLVGLAGVDKNLVGCMERGTMPSRLSGRALQTELEKIAAIIEKMADPDIFVWLKREAAATEAEMHRAATIVADRLCSAMANPIIRNAQERRQLTAIKTWLEDRRYRQIEMGDGTKWDAMEPGTFSFRMNVPVIIDRDSGKTVNIPVDAVIMPRGAQRGAMPMLIEAKSAGDFTNTNKRRKEEAVKMAQLKATYGRDVRFNLFLCGYFDNGYLGYEAAEGIDWVWEHRIGDLAEFGL